MPLSAVYMRLGWLVEGARRCEGNDGSCGIARADLVITPESGEPVELSGGETELVDSLLVTLGRNTHHYDVSGGCNFGISPEYIIAATAAVGR